MSAKKEKNAPKTYNIAPKEMIVTRNKSAQMRRQQHNTMESNPNKNFIVRTSPQRKQKKKGKEKKTKENRDDEAHTTEYYPEKPKRYTMCRKIILKPKHELKTIITLDEFKKRKPVSPKKQEQLVNFLEDISVNDVSEIKHESETELPLNEDKPKKYIPAEDLKNFSMAEIIMLDDESDELTEEDLMEIITCPSPVWWEDPPNDSYIEDPIDVRSSSTASRATENKSEDLETISIATTETESGDGLIPTRTTPDSNTINNISQTEETVLDIHGCSLKCDHTFLEKRTALENLLINLKRTSSVSVESDVNNKKEINTKPRAIDRTRKVKPSKKINSAEVLPQVPLEVLNDLENFEIPTAKSAKRNLLQNSECIVIDDDDDVDRDSEESSKDNSNVDPDAKLDNVLQNNGNITELVGKISAKIQNVIEDNDFDKKIKNSRPDIERFEANTFVNAKHDSMTSTVEKFKANADMSGETDDAEKNYRNIDINEKSRNTKATVGNVEGTVQRNVNCKIFIKKNATVKPKTILGISRSVLGNMVIPHSKALESSTKPLILPLRRVYINNISQNHHVSIVDSPPKTIPGDLSEVKSIIRNSVLKNDSRFVDSSVESELEKKEDEKSDNQAEQKSTIITTNGMINEPKGSTTEKYLKEPIKNVLRPQELTCDLHAEIQIVNSDDLEISISETSQMIKEAYIKFLKQDKTLRLEKGMLIQNRERVTDARLSSRNYPQFTSEDAKNKEASKIDRNSGENINIPLFKAVSLNNMAKTNANSLLNRNKIVKGNNSQPLSVPLMTFESEKIKNLGKEKADVKHRYVHRNPILKKILESKLDDIMAKVKGSSNRIVAESEKCKNRKRPYPENVKSDTIKRNQDMKVCATDMHEMKITKKAVGMQKLQKNEEALQVSALVNEFKGDTAKQLVECENCNLRFKSIAISKRNIVKYCYKCSSIFSTTNCDYCSKEGDGVNLRNPHPCPHCHYLCCCIQNLEKHLKSHADKQNNETPG